LFNRGIQNNVNLELMNVSKLKKFEPLAVIYERFLWSPTIGVSDPELVVNALFSDFIDIGGKIYFDTQIKLQNINGEIREE
jgi:hypothetical protein